jgi:hypothetical protein
MGNKFEIDHSEYGEMLQRAVKEILNARNLVAKQLTSATNSVYWSIVKLLFRKQLVFRKPFTRSNYKTISFL